MKSTILIVDDSPTLRGIVKIYLRPLPVEVLEEGSGERALQLARVARPSLILADINLPGMDGITFARLLRAEAEPAVRQIPLIFMIGDKSSELRQRAADAGADQLLEKPVKSGPLQDVVTRILEKKKEEEGRRA